MTSFRTCRGRAAWSVVFVILAQAASAGLRADRLRCEYLENPLGLDAARPRLSWIVEGDARGERQTAYQLRAASSAEGLRRGEADLWDSGRVASDETLHLAYGGPPLASGQQVHWQVRAWGREGQPSAWSKPAWFEMGLLRSADWSGVWIARTADTNYAPAPLLRKEFAVEGRVRRARAYICGLGYHELRLNGRIVGDHRLDPGYTRYDRRCLYVTHDVTDLIRRGANAVGVMLGTGWYNVHTPAVWDFHAAPWRASPRLLMQIRIEYEDGRTQVVATDGSWKTSTGPVVYDSIYGGETYDARREKSGWDAAGYDDRDWASAVAVPAPAGSLAAQAMPPIRITQRLKPVRIAEPTPGVFVADFGQNLAGCVEIRVRGRAGDRVALKYGERLAADGTVDQDEIAVHIRKRGPDQQVQVDTFHPAGAGTETWHARFTYHGFQYVEITGWPGRPGPGDLTALFQHSDVPRVGRFECSNPLLNRIQRAAEWAYLSNLQGIPTDCPHREKNGWTGDAHLAAEQALFTFAPAAVYTKWIRDLGDEQRPTGELPGIVPTSGWGYQWGNGPAWDSAYLLLPDYLRTYCADTRLLREQYDGLKRYVDYLTTRASNHLVRIGLGDWAPYKTKTPEEVTSTGYYLADVRIVAAVARLLGREDEARRYDALAVEIRAAFAAKHLQPDGTVANGSQTAQSCALYQDLVPAEARAKVFAKLVEAVEKAGGGIDTGILGAKYLLRTLTEHGRHDLAYGLVAHTNAPGWGAWIAQGATTLWEQWDGKASRNHIMYGDVSAWFYETLAGIQPDPARPGFKHFTVRPRPVADLAWARAEYDSARGRISAAWAREGDGLRLDVTVPANTTATVWIPAGDGEEVREGGQPLDQADGISRIGRAPGLAVAEAASGTYRFRVTPPPRPRAAAKDLSWP